ncbi:uncharacterized protein CELE_F14H3.14 [Caenorhabditis elegans]|uniref:Uncharacterized protein n=1 Tax=Caenorhabditis elegans TaxID=6239 RepID=A7LPJ3_CAEEL|nr:Uncharacterized protein CELE_F14H3.14 [Caenorhabditis elegans]CAO82022.1 Uncharacterized protein CELE_F14H3.14 [Caenorhabditis elegans]|eukprot:NP_001122916.1 Uncharacterized protein CELE_F14H3.14 [Caenorhabditis elegans]
MRFFILIFLTIFVVSLLADDVVPPTVVSGDAIASHPIRVLMVAGRGK